VFCALVIGVLISGLSAREARADKRKYVWTYEYLTMDRGEGEIEQYLTFSTPDSGAQGGKTTSEFQLEYEVGMSDRFDFLGLYCVQTEAGSGPQIRRLQVPVALSFRRQERLFYGPLLYLEYKGKPNFSENAVEFKVILAKDRGRWNLALIPYVEWARKGEWDTIWKYATGVGYQPIKLLSLGVEFKGSEKGHYWGPVISHGKGNLWMAVGSVFHIGDVDDGEPETQIRMLFGYEVG
jgi:hypothetical protein